MCGRFSLTKPREVQARFGFVDWHERRIEPHFNIAPSQDILTIVHPQEGEPVVQPAIWGLAPYWLPPGRRKRPPINARAESVASSGLFRGALANSRCLIPATGFYEWRAEPDGTKTPMHIQLRDGQPFAFAGLWLPNKDGQPTAAIITVGPNGLTRPIHDRMPAILGQEDEEVWLDPGLTNPELITPLLQPYDAEAMCAYPVAPLVNSVVNDSAELIVPRMDAPHQSERRNVNTPSAAHERHGQLILPLPDGLTGRPG